MGKMLRNIFLLSNRTEGPEMACGRNEFALTHISTTAKSGLTLF